MKRCVLGSLPWYLNSFLIVHVINRFEERVSRSCNSKGALVELAVLVKRTNEGTVQEKCPSATVRSLTSTVQRQQECNITHPFENTPTPFIFSTI